MHPEGDSVTVTAEHSKRLPGGWLGWILPSVFVVAATVVRALGASYLTTLAAALLIALTITAVGGVARRRRARQSRM
jgi:hypothetical protein